MFPPNWMDAPLIGGANSQIPELGVDFLMHLVMVKK
tara:strand:- start:338 stop:445 length:108 start_codon:yes stop_codon:yes gene_type:complete